MDKYNTNTTFNKWLSSINLSTLSEGAQKEMTQFNKDVKKMDLESFLKLLFHAIHDQKETLRHLENTVMNLTLQQEVGLIAISYAQVARFLRHLPTLFFVREILSTTGTHRAASTKAPSKKVIYIID